MGVGVRRHMLADGVKDELFRRSGPSPNLCVSRPRTSLRQVHYAYSVCPIPMGTVTPFVFREALVTWLNALPHHRAGAIVYHRWPFKRPRTADASPAFPAGHFESQSPNRIR